MFLRNARLPCRRSIVFAMFVHACARASFIFNVWYEYTYSALTWQKSEREMAQTQLRPQHGSRSQRNLTYKAITYKVSEDKSIQSCINASVRQLNVVIGANSFEYDLSNNAHEFTIIWNPNAPSYKIRVSVDVMCDPNEKIATDVQVVLFQQMLVNILGSAYSSLVKNGYNETEKQKLQTELSIFFRDARWNVCEREQEVNKTELAKQIVQANRLQQNRKKCFNWDHPFQGKIMNDMFKAKDVDYTNNGCNDGIFISYIMYELLIRNSDNLKHILNSEYHLEFDTEEFFRNSNVMRVLFIQKPTHHMFDSTKSFGNNRILLYDFLRELFVKKRCTENCEDITPLKTIFENHLNHDHFVSVFKKLFLNEYDDEIAAFLIKINSIKLKQQHQTNNGIITYIRIRGDTGSKMSQANVFTEVKHNKLSYIRAQIPSYYSGENNEKVPIPYISGPYTQIFSKETNNTQVVIRSKDIIKALNNGSSVFVVGYGASGAGKTSTLIYFREGKEEGIMLQLLKSLNPKPKKIKLNIHEFYKPTDDYDTNHNIYSLNGDLIFKLLDGEYVLDNNSPLKGTQIKTQTYVGVDIELQVGEKLQICIIELMDKQKMRRIAATTNNPQSSRSHVLISLCLDCESENDNKYLFIADFAGVENEFRCDSLQELVKFANIKGLDKPNTLFYSNETIHEELKICKSKIVPDIGINKIFLHNNNSDLTGIILNESNRTQINGFNEKPISQSTNILNLLLGSLKLTEIDTIKDLEQKIETFKAQQNHTFDEEATRKTIQELKNQYAEYLKENYNTYISRDSNKFGQAPPPLVNSTGVLFNINIDPPSTSQVLLTAIRTVKQEHPFDNVSSIKVNNAVVGSIEKTTNKFVIRAYPQLSALISSTIGNIDYSFSITMKDPEYIVTYMRNPEIGSASQKVEVSVFEAGDRIKFKKAQGGGYVGDVYIRYKTVTIDEFGDVKLNNMQKTTKYISDKLVEYYEVCIRHLKTIREICRCRSTEGKYINSEIAAMRDTIFDLIRKRKNVMKYTPVALPECMDDLFPVLPLPAEPVDRNTSTLLAHHMLDKIHESKKDLAIVIFNVFNNSEQNEERTLYVDINDLKAVYQRWFIYDKYFDIPEGTPPITLHESHPLRATLNKYTQLGGIMNDLLKSITKLKMQLRKYVSSANFYHNTLANEILNYEDQVNKSKPLLDEIYSTVSTTDGLNQLKRLLDFIQTKNNTSPLGTLEFMDHMARMDVDDSTMQTCTKFQSRDEDILLTGSAFSGSTAPTRRNVNAKNG